jgi:hypothetical protein
LLLSFARSITAKIAEAKSIKREKLELAATNHNSKILSHDDGLIVRGSD